MKVPMAGSRFRNPNNTVEVEEQIKDAKERNKLKNNNKGGGGKKRFRICI